jgi:hypothetical protein
MERASHNHLCLVRCPRLDLLYCSTLHRRLVISERQFSLTKSDRMDARVDKRRMGDFVWPFWIMRSVIRKRVVPLLSMSLTSLNGFYAVTISFDGDWLKTSKMY